MKLKQHHDGIEIAIIHTVDLDDQFKTESGDVEFTLQIQDAEIIKL